MTTLQRLHHARRNFVSRWRNPRAVYRDEALRRLDALVVLGLSVVALVVAIQGDEVIARSVSGFPAWVYAFFGYVTRLGDSGYIFAGSAIIGLAALLLRKRGQGVAFDRACLFLAERAGFVFIVNVVSGIASQVLKHLFGRARPPLIDVVGPFHFDMFSMSSRYASMPSGHSITAFATALALSYLMPRWRWAFIFVAAMVCVSRVIISAHYPSDVLIGAIIGSLSAILLRRAFARRGIAFSHTPAGPRLRGAGKVWPALARVFNS
jgi:undecaprenyl-diphosphatase